MLYQFDILRSIFYHSIFCVVDILSFDIMRFDIVRFRYFATRYSVTSILHDFDILLFVILLFDILSGFLLKYPAVVRALARKVDMPLHCQEVVSR